MKRWLVLIVGMMMLGNMGSATARDVEADPSKDYAISPQAGPWLICAASFTGPEAAQLAHELTLVIRRDYKMPAYIFDRGTDERRKQQEEIAKVRRDMPEGRIRMVRIEEQFAVLVGDYKDMGSARQFLDTFRKLPPPPAKFCDEGTVQAPGTDKNQKGVWITTIRVSPFLYSFVVRNPMIAPEQVKNDNDYPFIKQLNSEESLSLLKCPKHWTLAVQTFYGSWAVQPQNKSSKFLDNLPFGNKSGTLVNAAAMQAHELAGAMRKMKPVAFEAYVLHMRNTSIVTVGAYDSPNDAKLVQDQQLLAKMKLQTPGLQLFVQPPLPMEVPKP